MDPLIAANQLLQQAIDALQADRVDEALTFADRAKSAGVPVRDANYVYAICLVKQLRLVDACAALLDELRNFPDNHPANQLRKDILHDLIFQPPSPNESIMTLLAKRLLAKMSEISKSAEKPALRTSAPSALPAPRYQENLRQQLIIRSGSPFFINQFVTTLAYGDGVGNCVRLVRRTLIDWGFQSHIFAEGADERLAGEWSWFGHHQSIAGGQNLALYHPSDGRSPMIPYLAAIPDQKILYYHNITPGQFFAPWDPLTANICDTARQAVAAIAPNCAGAICDSEYNAREIRDMGCRETHVVPIPFLRNDFLSQAPDSTVLSKYRDGSTNILFVGRLAPNKCQHDVIRAFHSYRQNFQPHSRLILAGAANGSEEYTRYLQELVAELKLENNVVITGHISFAELVAYYHCAQAFLCLSEHEGFCIPLLEAMHFGLPIVALRSSAVTETLAGSGLLIEEKSADFVAAQLHRALTDASLKAQILQGQRQQVEHYSEERCKEALAKAICRLLDIQTARSEGRSAVSL